MVCMVLAVPSMWLSQRVVSTEGFVSSASVAAHDAHVQDYFAQKVASSVEDATGSKIAADLVLPAARNYAQSDGFVADFSEVARQQHEWLFTAPDADTDLHLMEFNITPMINRVVQSAPLPIPVTIDREVIVTVDQSQITAGSLEDSGTLVDILAWVSVIGAIVASLIALMVSTRRTTVLAWLGVGGVLAGLAGWGIAVFTDNVVHERLANTDEASRNTIEVVVSGIVDNLSTVSLYVGIGGAVVLLVAVVARVASAR